MIRTREGGAVLADDAGEDRPIGPYEIEDDRIVPSLLHRVHAFVDLEGAEPSRLSVGEAAEILAFCRHHDIHHEDAARLTTSRSHEAKAARGIWQNILLNLRNYQEGDPELPQRGRIPIAEIHVPRLVGCEGTYTNTNGSGAKVGLTVKICGLAGGGGREAKVTLSSALTSPACGQVTIPGAYQVTPWTNPDQGSRIDLVTFTEFLPDSFGLRGIPADRDHFCALGTAPRLAQLAGVAGAVFRVHDVAVAGSSLKISQAVEASRELTLSIDDVVEMKSSFLSGFSYEWKLVGGANYLRFFENSRSHVHMWCWD